MRVFQTGGAWTTATVAAGLVCQKNCLVVGGWGEALPDEDLGVAFYI